VKSSVVYDVDGVAKRLGDAVVGYEDRPATYAEMRASGEVHFVKTHRRRDAEIEEADRAICLVRDGRDALVSWARMTSEGDPSQFETQLQEMIERRATTGTGSWGSNVLSWLEPVAVHRVVLRFETLIADPLATVARAMAAVAPELPQVAGATTPDFATLRSSDEKFFRRGVSGSHRDEMPAHLHRLFWSRPDNAAAMALLGLD
jgi:hypothetical protein